MRQPERRVEWNLDERGLFLLKKQNLIERKRIYKKYGIPVALGIPTFILIIAFEDVILEPLSFALVVISVFIGITILIEMATRSTTKSFTIDILDNDVFELIIDGKRISKFDSFEDIVIDNNLVSASIKTMYGKIPIVIPHSIFDKLYQSKQSANNR